jgi:hypothetical protein
MRPWASVAGNALNAVNAAFKTHLRVHLVALDHGDDFLDATGGGAGDRNDVDLPLVALGETLVHAQHFLGEQGGFVAAGAGADFEDDVLVVVRILGDEQGADGSVSLIALFLKLAQLLEGHGLEFGIGFRLDHLLDSGNLGQKSLVLREHPDHGPDVRCLFRGFGDARHGAARGSQAEHLRFEDVVPLLDFLQLLESDGVHGFRAFVLRSKRIDRRRPPGRFEFWKKDSGRTFRRRRAAGARPWGRRRASRTSW